MFQSKRQSEILQAVRLSGSCSIGELAERFEVSGETIRRNIKPLVTQGLVRRVHGGVTLPERLQEPPFQKRMQENSAEKQRIARRVAEQIDNGDTLILDCGSTTTYVARALSQHRSLVVVTNSAEIARTLATNDSNKVFMAGGELRSDDTASLGPEALAFVGQFQVRHAILSLGAIDAEGNMMVYHLSEAEFSRAVMERAENVIVAVDHSKFGRSGLVRICEPGRVDSLVTDEPPPEPLRGKLEAAEVEILLA